MKHYALSLMMLAGFLSPVIGQEKSEKKNNDTISFTNALNYRLLGKGFSDTEESYDRLPAHLKDKIRKPVWVLSKNSSGMAVRFRTNSHFIATRYELDKDKVMNHMAPTGIKGVDLYCLEEDGKWHYVITGRPQGKNNEMVLIQNMIPEEREYMLYFPLYDGVKSLEIGVGKNSTIATGKADLPAAGNPVVVYGTSITQGGCASRPGMSYTNILSRQLNKEFVNLGFSGNAKLDMEIAESIAKMSPSCIIIDCVANCTVDDINKKALPFMRHVREAHPDVPVVMVEGPYFPHQKYDQKLASSLPKKNEAYKAVFDQLVAENPKNIHYVKNTNLTGADREGTVDGIHLTDLGFHRMAQNLYPVVKPLVHQTKVIAHRGYWDCEGSAQNSITALEKAAQAGVWGSEFDVQITGDTVVIVNHDNTIEGMNIGETPFKKLRKIKLKNGEKLPTLEAYLKTGKKYPDLMLVLEIKPHATQVQEKAAVREVVRQVREMGMEDQVVYISFSKYICEEVHATLPKAQVAILTDKVTPQQAKAAGFTGVDYHHNVYVKNPEYMGYCEEVGLSTNVWTVNKPEMIQQFIDLQVDYLTTDNPVVAKELVERKNK
ncbi:MAG: SGNH/GDSL hydrolase family protein [Bacteroidales bacterium]